MFTTRISFLIFLVLLASGCTTHNHYTIAARPEGFAETSLPPAPYYMPPQQPLAPQYSTYNMAPTAPTYAPPQQQANLVVDPNAFPKVGAATQGYIKSIPPGTYAPMWANLAIAGGPNRIRVANILVGVNNRRWFAAADGPEPDNKLPWQPMEVQGDALNSDRSVKLGADGRPIKIMYLAWVAGVGGRLNQ